MRTEMTKGVGFDKYWDAGGGDSSLVMRRISITLVKADTLYAAIAPDEAAGRLIKFIDTFDIKSTGEYWAPGGARWVIFCSKFAFRISADFLVAILGLQNKHLDQKTSSLLLSNYLGR